MSDEANQSQTSPSSAPAAGWYPNPQGQGLRWWDGSAWTEHTHEEAPAGGDAAPAGAAPASTTPAASTAAAAKPAKSDKKRVNFINDNALAILIVLLVILAVVVALQVL